MSLFFTVHGYFLDRPNIYKRKIHIIIYIYMHMYIYKISSSGKYPKHRV